MNAYIQSIRFLYSLEVFGMKFGLKGIRTLLASIGDPHKDFPSVHVAGTNGKGSTSSMLAAVFTAAGYKTGLYTSPHLISFTERIRIDGKPIAPKDVVRLTNLVKKQVMRQQATYFEAVTAIAFKYFADAKVDIAIVETGLGGRLDATNVLRPLVSVITNVSLEHTEILGNTLGKIAWEKAGIIKRAIPCVTGISQAKALTVLRRQAKAKRSPLFTTRDVRIIIRKSTLEGLIVQASINGETYRNLRVSVAGNHQAMNLRIVLRTIDLLNDHGAYTIDESQLRRGLMNIETLAGLTARLSVLRRHPLVLADVAHNPDSIRRLVNSLRDLNIRNVVLVFGVVRDKDYRRMVRFLKPITMSAILTMAKTTRARPIEDLKHEFSRQRIDVVGIGPTVVGAMDLAFSVARRRDTILIAGSHYVVGEALSFLRSRKFT